MASRFGAPFGPGASAFPSSSSASASSAICGASSRLFVTQCAFTRERTARQAATVNSTFTQLRRSRDACTDGRPACRNPELEGRFVIDLVIGRDGTVTNGKEGQPFVAGGEPGLPDRNVEACLLRTAYGLKSPRPAAGIGVAGLELDLFATKP